LYLCLGKVLDSHSTPVGRYTTRFLAPGTALQRFWTTCLTQWEEHLKAQAEGRRFSVYSLSINPTLQVAILLGGYSTSASCDALFAYVASTYEKRASTIPPLDLPLVSIGTFLQARRSSLTLLRSVALQTLQRLFFTSNPWICIQGA
jgi:hypothetical protein